MVTGLVEFEDLVAHKAYCEEIHCDLSTIEVAVGIYRVDCGRVQDEIDNRYQHLSGILVHGGAHPIGVHVCPETGVILIFVVDED